MARYSPIARCDPNEIERRYKELGYELPGLVINTCHMMIGIFQRTRKKYDQDFGTLEIELKNKLNVQVDTFFLEWTSELW